MLIEEIIIWHKTSSKGMEQEIHKFYLYSWDSLKSFGDHSLFVLRQGSDMAYLLLYVDDIIWTASSDSLRHSIISRLSAEFAMKDLGSLNYFLGIVVFSHDGGLFLSKQKYAEEIIEPVGLPSCKTLIYIGGHQA